MHQKYAKMVKPKKKLGQHFLTDLEIAKKVALTIEGISSKSILEIGAGTGALSQFLLERFPEKSQLLDVDEESISYLKEYYPEHSKQVHFLDFLDKEALNHFTKPYSIVGNFPYNISSQIVFKIMDNCEDIPEWGGMFQKEVALRIASPSGNKTYGILSVLTQAYYTITYEFSIPPHVFNPPPKVNSGVLKAVRYRTEIEGLSFKSFKDIVKTAFNQRRKTLSNALGKYGIEKSAWERNDFAKLRAEQLNVDQFIELALFVQENKK